MKSILLCSILSLFVQVALGAAVLVQSGGAAYLDFQDGRKAILTHALGKVFHTKLGLRQIENTCNPGQILATCSMSLDVAAQPQYLRWSEHPDKTKIGQVVQARYPKATQASPVQDEFQTYFWFGTLQNKQWEKNFQPDEISCNNYLWTDQMPRINGNILVQSWTGEIMIGNPETGMNENQTISGAFNVELEKTPNNTLRIVKVGPSHTFTNTPPYLSTQVSSITFDGGKNQQCQVAFEVDVQDIFKAVQDPNFRVADPNTELPITLPSEIGTFSNLQNYLREFLRAGSQLEAE